MGLGFRALRVVGLGFRVESYRGYYGDTGSSDYSFYASQDREKCKISSIDNVQASGTNNSRPSPGAASHDLSKAVEKLAKSKGFGLILPNPVIMAPYKSRPSKGSKKWNRPDMNPLLH